MSVRDEVATPLVPGKESPVRPHGRRRALLIVAAMLVVAGGAVAAVILTSPPYGWDFALDLSQALTVGGLCR